MKSALKRSRENVQEAFKAALKDASGHRVTKATRPRGRAKELHQVQANYVLVACSDFLFGLLNLRKLNK